MRVTIYNNKSPNNKLNKDLEIIIPDLSGAVKEPLSATDKGEILITYQGVLSGNYIYISDIDKYYYIHNIEYIRSGVIKITISVDVLMSYKSDILALPVIVKRGEYINNNYISDNEITAYNFNNVITRKFNKSFDNYNYYLVVAGS